MKSFSNIAKKGKVPWVRLWIDATWDFCENFIDRETGKVDYEALGREEYEFRKALKYGDFEKNERAKFLWDEAVAKHTAKSENGKLGGRPRKDKEITEDAPAREDGDELTTPGNGKRWNPPPSSGHSSETDGSRQQNGRGEVTPPPERKRTKKTSSSPRLPSWQEVLEFVNARGLDYTDAREWYEMTVVDRKGNDKDGNRIANLKASLVGFCKVKFANRRNSA